MSVRNSLLAVLMAVPFSATGYSQQAPIEFAAPVSVVMADKVNAVRMADVDSDGHLDIIALQGEPSLVSGMFVALGDGNGNFDAPVFNAISINWPWAVDVGDINEDGTVDAVVTDFLSGQFAYLEGNGDGTFSEQPRLVPGWGGGNPQVQVADIDDDGHLDVIAADFFGSKLQVAWGTGIDDPLAAFDGLATVPLTGFPLSLDIADLDGDGDLDLCCGFNSGSGGGVATSLYQGNRTFSAEERSIGGLSESHWSTMAIDLDGGFPEIVTVDEGLGSLGIFTLAAGIPQPGIPIFTGSNQRHVAGGDLDLDGVADLVIRNFSSGSFLILQGVGALKFVEVLLIDGPVAFSGLELVDVNEDGSLDIVAGNYDQSTVSYYLNLTASGAFIRGELNGDGNTNIADAVFLLAYLFNGGPTPGCLDAADTNDDGGVNISDAVTLLAVLFNGASPFPEPVGSCGQDPTADALECEDSGSSCL
ncbi:MAG TPA: hypothetical protein EYN00_06050 [Planctomycetes bacterium]|nr:hypothetical protein [Planctomycetota bacterium]